MYAGGMKTQLKRRGGSMVKFGAFRLEGCRFEFYSSRHVGTLGKSFTRSCLQRFGVLTPSINAELPMSSSGLEEALQKYPERMNEDKNHSNKPSFFHALPYQCI